MKQEALALFTDTHWTIIALFIFFTCFSIITIWSLRRNGKKHYDQMAHMPLKEVENEQR